MYIKNRTIRTWVQFVKHTRAKMDAIFRAVTVLVCFGIVTESAKIQKQFPKTLPLPSYISRACSRNDPNFEKCAVEVGAPAIKMVARGDPAYRIPSLDPLELRELAIRQGTNSVGLNLILRNCQLWNLENSKFYDIKMNFKEKKGELFLSLDKLKITGQYTASGRVLILPIAGKGDCEIGLKNLKYSWKFQWTVEKNKNGVEHAKFISSDFPLHIGNMTINFENLFNGDKFLGNHMNKFLNENWTDVMRDLRPALSKTLGQLCANILNTMASIVPFDAIFPPK